MGLFDFFKKKEEPAYDPTNLKLTDLRVGFMLDYDMQTWEVQKAFEYDWGNHYFTYEFQLFNGEEVIYLSVDDNEELALSVSRSVKIRQIQEDLPDYIVERETAPNKLVYKGVMYYLDEDSAGYSKPIGASDDDWAELINYDYYDETEKKILSVSQYGEREFEASAGRVAKGYEFSNIIPGKS
ncbi:MAG: DUF4178 domain-containing protein [Cytophagales bacterium]|nr:DUF4178 domain-containing protein [Cytophagales bacterium]